MIGLMILLGVSLAIVSGLVTFAFETQLADFVYPMLGGVIGVSIYVWAIAMFTAGTTNLLYTGIVIPSWYTFESNITTWGLFKVYLVNTVLIVLTLGFYMPFAKIRMINYRVNMLKFVSTQPLDNFVFDSDSDVAAIGQEMGEMFDLGVGL